MSTRKNSTFVSSLMIWGTIFSIIVIFVSIHACSKNIQDSLYEDYYKGIVATPANIEQAVGIIAPVEGENGLANLFTGSNFIPNTAGYKDWYLYVTYDLYVPGLPDPTKGDIQYQMVLYKGNQELDRLYILSGDWKDIGNNSYEAVIQISEFTIDMVLHHFGKNRTDWGLNTQVTSK